MASGRSAVTLLVEISTDRVTGSAAEVNSPPVWDATRVHVPVWSKVKIESAIVHTEVIVLVNMTARLELLIAETGKVP